MQREAGNMQVEMGGRGFCADIGGEHAYIKRRSERGGGSK